jgi:hypothetical protein
VSRFVVREGEAEVQPEEFRFTYRKRRTNATTPATASGWRGSTWKANRSTPSPENCRIGSWRSAPTSSRAASSTAISRRYRRSYARRISEWGWLDAVPALRLREEPARPIRWIKPDEAGACWRRSRVADMAEFSLAPGLRLANVTGFYTPQRRK